jgi:hypothetical protein
MRSSWLVMVVAGMALAACGSSESGGREGKLGDQSANPALASLPATVEGFLDMSLGEGSDEEDGSETLWGGLTVGQEDLYIQVDSKLLDAAAIPAEGAKVRATIGSKDDLGGGMVHYRITALEKL